MQIAEQALVPRMYVSAHASTLIKLGHIWVSSGSDPDYYPGQWVIWVSDADLVAMLIAMPYSPTLASPTQISRTTII